MPAFRGSVASVINFQRIQRLCRRGRRRQGFSASLRLDGSGGFRALACWRRRNAAARQCSAGTCPAVDPGTRLGLPLILQQHRPKRRLHLGGLARRARCCRRRRRTPAAGSLRPRRGRRSGTSNACNIGAEEPGRLSAAGVMLQQEIRELARSAPFGEPGRAAMTGRAIGSEQLRRGLAGAEVFAVRRRGRTRRLSKRRRGADERQHADRG